MEVSIAGQKVDTRFMSAQLQNVISCFLVPYLSKSVHTFFSYVSNRQKDGHENIYLLMEVKLCQKSKN